MASSPEIPESKIKIDWRDVFIAGVGLMIEAWAVLFGVSILTLAAAGMLWLALRGYRRERGIKASTGFDLPPFCGPIIM